jgi:hypothetical protein
LGGKGERKIITDRFKFMQLSASGSSSFDLSNKINVPLSGRKWGWIFIFRTTISNRLLYGFYLVLNNPRDIIRPIPSIL